MFSMACRRQKSTVWENALACCSSGVGEANVLRLFFKVGPLFVGQLPGDGFVDWAQALDDVD